MSRIKRFISSTITTISRHPRWAVAVPLVLVLLIGAGLYLRPNTAEETEETQTTPRVEVASVASLSENTGPIELIGEVRSLSQAELKAQKSGEVIRVNVTAGRAVAAGTVLVEIENAQERAAVVSAEGGLTSAEAALARVRAGARSEDRASVGAAAESAETALRESKTSARSAYESALATAEDAVFVSADRFFRNPQTADPSFSVNSVLYDERQPIERERVELEALLRTWRETSSQPIADNELDVALRDVQSRLERIKSFVTTVSSYIAKQEVKGDTTLATIAADNGVIQGARASLDGAIASVSNARNGLAAAESTAIAASGSESKTATGERPEDIRAAEGTVISARGGLLSARAAFEKTLVRAPISGTVTTLGPVRGDFVNMFDDVATIAGSGGLQVETFVTADIKDRIVVGTNVTLEDGSKGIVVSVEPGVDPATKRSKVVVGLPAQGTSFENGSFIRLTIDDGIATSTPKVRDTSLYIPISAIKVLPTGLVVFTVEADMKLKAHPVSEGAIVGDRMRITEGLTSDMEIVTDARGLNEGEQVEVAVD